uniref:Putative ovule protein n=1 Tax=Solanum chacoense TaxID=4108 RepID=A0A0V0GTJ9_SOLCH
MLDIIACLTHMTANTQNPWRIPFLLIKKNYYSGTIASPIHQYSTTVNTLNWISFATFIADTEGALFNWLCEL